jgi:hypothetical protein
MRKVMWTGVVMLSIVCVGGKNWNKFVLVLFRIVCVGGKDGNLCGEFVG